MNPAVAGQNVQVKILHVVGDSKFGGASLGILRLAQFWTAIGWKVELLATDPAFLAAASQCGIAVTPLDVIWREIRPWKDFCGLIRLYRFLRHNPYLVVHTHTTKAGFIGRLAARLAGVPIVVHTAHGFAFHENSPRLKVLFYTALERIASWCCDRVIAVSYFHERWGNQLGYAHPSRWTAIPNGIPQPLTLRSRVDVRRELGIPHNELMVFTPGRLVPEKGLEELLHAMRLLKARLSQPVRLVLAGEGSLRAPLERMAQQLNVATRIQFLGFRGDIADLLAASDMVALPSWREGLSIALLEAMALAKPLIVSHIGSNREATAGGKAALLVPPGDPEAIADALIELASDSERRAALGAQAKAIYDDNYVLSRMLSSYHKLYLRLFAEHGIATPDLSPSLLEQNLHACGLLALDARLRAAPPLPQPSRPTPQPTGTPENQQDPKQEKTLA